MDSLEAAHHHALLAGKQDPALFLARETWDHMQPQSGFEGFSDSIASQWQGLVYNCPLREVSPDRPPSVFTRILRKLEILPKPNPERTRLPPSHIVEAKHERLAERLCQDLHDDPSAIGLLASADAQYCGPLLEASSSVRSRLVLCFHQPPSWLRIFWRRNDALDGVKGMFALSSVQADYLRRLTSSPVWRIDHGVRHDFFCPGAKAESERGRLLVVGSWLRDFRVLHEALSLLWESHPSVEVDIVIPWKYRDYWALLELAQDNRVHWHAGLTAEQLRSLYQKASLLFLPLRDGTANNALVEASACGLPIVSSRVGGLAEIAPADVGEFCPPGDSAAHAEALKQWLNDPDRRKRAGASLRKFAESVLDWEIIANRAVEALRGKLDP